MEKLFADLLEARSVGTSKFPLIRLVNRPNEIST